MVILKTDEEISGIREASKIVAKTLKYIEQFIIPGVNTYFLNRRIDEFIRQCGGIPTFLGYKGFPASACISVNNEVVHGIPSKNKIIKDGDIVKIDIGVTYKGYIGDGAMTFLVGNVNKKIKKLVETTKDALYKGISTAREGVYLVEVSRAIQNEVEKHGFSVVRDLAGHGVGIHLHEDPSVPNFVEGNKKGPKLKAGMTLAIEPMVNLGDHRVRILPDGWTIVTADGLPSAHFEHTVAITKNGTEILTTIN